MAKTEAQSATRFIIHGAVISLVIGFVILITYGIHTARTALIAEENFQAFFHVHAATLEYIQQNDGAWPTSWDDLRGARPQSDFDWVAKHVEFDFDANPVEIAAQSPDTFTAIVPSEPCYVIDAEVQYLIDALREFHLAPNAT